MAPRVKRSYDAASRSNQSRETRQRIVDSARVHIIEHGYRATTIAAVARDASVSVDTVYALVGRKPVLLRELIEQAISGTDHAVTAEARDYVRAIHAEPAPEKKLAIYARSVCAVQARMAPLFMALRDASATESEADEVWREISARRAANMRRFARELGATGRLRPDVSIPEASDVLWATTSSEFYALFVGDRGWSTRRFERWLTTTWTRLLLTDG
ncbi:MAG: TetR/AcrR family transcriptional regulator [Acidimicrobiia bacterium]|nr:TetR/AcrR family transcriptional regulator [Acidimicrobiia bacterium]